MADREVRLEARAKLNLFLRVLRRRADGYHDLQSLVVPLSLSDTVVVRPGGGDLRLSVRGSDALVAAVPPGPGNLVLEAARALARACGQGEGAEVEVEKRIPVAAGLGGGSADAAATLLALNELWGCRLSFPDLLGVAARVGSDVPALLPGGPVLVHGRGEAIATTTVAPLWWVLVPAGFPVRAAHAYRWWDEDGGVTGPDPEPLLRAAAAGDVAEVGRLLFNDLEGPVFRRHPGLAETRDRLLEGGSCGAVMCGSGPTLAGLAPDRGSADWLAGAFPAAFVVAGPPGDELPLPS